MPGEQSTREVDRTAREAPIGVFDSGVGGLTVVAALRRRLPAEHVLYLGDTARLPYGGKSPEVVARYTQRNVDFLTSHGVKAVVVACNSASAVALDALESPVPVWGVIEPGVAAAAATGARRVGVLATEATVRSGAYTRSLRRLDAAIEVVAQACPLLVPLVEEDWADDPLTLQVIRRYLEPVLEDPVGALVLGCTHYPLLRDQIGAVARELGASPVLIDSAEAVSARVEDGLRSLGLSRPPADGAGGLRLFVTDPGPRIQRIAQKILGGAPGAAPAAIPSLEWVDIQV